MTNSNDRLDRIERTLERLAERDEILAIRLERLTLGLEETKARLEETRAIANSNSRTIQGMLERSESERLEHEENMGVMRDAIQRLIRLEEAQNRMLVGLDEDRPIILRKLNVIENKVDRILDRTSE